LTQGYGYYILWKNVAYSDIISMATIGVGIGISAAKDQMQAIKEAAGQARVSLDKDKIDLVMVFSTIEFAHSIILKTIAEFFAPAPVIGCSSLAIISHQGIFKYGLAVLLVSLPEGAYFNTGLVKKISAQSAATAGGALAEKLLYGFQNTPRAFGVLFSDGLIQDGPGIIIGLQERLGLSFPIIGASASDNLAFQKTFIYFNQDVYNDSVCGMLWGGKIAFGLGIKHGWKPLGKPRRITKSHGNIVQEIDNEPAVKIYQEYFAKNTAALKKDLKHISILYPIGIYLAGEEEYTLRNLLFVEDDGSLVFQGDVPQETTMRLMIGSKESCLTATHQAIGEAKRSLVGHAPGLVLVFNSASRMLLLGRRTNQELDIIKEGFGKDTPLIGIYTYGEQAPLSSIDYLGRTHFHNQTITILAIGTKNGRAESGHYPRA
jgi:hypothetical protein